MKTKLTILFSLVLFSAMAQVQPFNYGGEFTGTVTINDSISVEGVINVPDGVLDSHAAKLVLNIISVVESGNYGFIILKLK